MRKGYSKKLCIPSITISLVFFVFGFLTLITCCNFGIVSKNLFISSKELDEFIGNMTTQNFEELSKFFETMPKLQHVIKIKNPKTKKTGEVTLEGMQSFFG